MDENGQMIPPLSFAELSFRKALTSDLAAVAALQQRSILALSVSFYGVEGAQAWARWQATDATDLLTHSQTVFVAEDQARELVAVGSWRPDAQASEIAWVRAVFVSPHVGRCGIGRRIMAVIEESATMAGRTVLRLVASKNAKLFYEALGYTTVAPRSWEIEPGLVLPCTLMEKPTSSSA